jgi:hypothetical protein
MHNGTCSEYIKRAGESDTQGIAEKLREDKFKLDRIDEIKNKFGVSRLVIFENDKFSIINEETKLGH